MKQQFFVTVAVDPARRLDIQEMVENMHSAIWEMLPHQPKQSITVTWIPPLAKQETGDEPA